MEVIFVLVPISLVIIGAALWAFVWSVRNNQFDDLEKEAHSILFDEDTPTQHLENRPVKENP